MLIVRFGGNNVGCIAEQKARERKIKLSPEHSHYLRDELQRLAVLFFRGRHLCQMHALRLCRRQRRQLRVPVLARL
jgi:hypothetical protein